MLEQRCNHSNQYYNNVATLCCAKNPRYKYSRVTSALTGAGFFRAKGAISVEDARARTRKEKQRRLHKNYITNQPSTQATIKRPVICPNSF